MSEATTTSECIAFIHEKLNEAERGLVAREQSAECWRGGDSKMWRGVGCKASKSERLAIAETEERIAASYRREIELYRATIAALQCGVPL